MAVLHRCKKPTPTAPLHRHLLHACAITAVLFSSVGTPAFAQENRSKAPLPIRDVVLFSSGVGYFQHTGEIDGGASIPFSFRTEQINDLLKSLVLFDPAGQVKPVTYTTHDPASRGLAGLGIDLNTSLSMGAILRQFQGAQVRVTTAGGVVEGRIVSVSTQILTTDKTTAQIDILNLLTPAGLTSIPLHEIKQVKFLDEKYEAKFRDALSLLAAGLDKERKTVYVNFGGERRRDVRMGYLLEAPVWKTSYRLVLGDNKPHYLQGWAVVENMTDEDWKDVNLSLVSGRPVSFIQNLYLPLYIPRPVVQPQIVGSPRPQLHAGNLGTDGSVAQLEAENVLRDEVAALSAPNAPPPAGQPTGGGGFGGGINGVAEMRKSTMARRRNLGEAVDRLATSVAAQAEGSERGELFEYAIAQPVTLPSRQAAMVPIVGSDIGGEKLSIFNPQVNDTYPMNAVKLVNTTGLHLSGGPLTVFSDGVYAGDGQIANLQPNEERLISYAVDLQVEGKYETQSLPQQFLSLRADSGVLHITRRQRLEHRYTFKNKDDEPRTIIVEQPFLPDWKLIQPAKADETTNNLYRFRMTVPAKTTGEFTAVTEQPLFEAIQLVNADINTILYWAQNAQLSEKLRASLKVIVEMRQRITNLQRQRQQAENEIRAITEEQARIRENMKTLDKDNPLYQQYVKKLTEQESRIEALRAEVRQLQAAGNSAQAELQRFLETLNVE
ncbi:MAG: DUF4139 domain-containing protein [Armatimonadetes bacterium]|nr:DUF4139 domain-containing protein [Armatimonadota bacterium]